MTRVCILSMTLFGLEGLAAGQVLVEGAVGAGGAAASAGPARSIGRNMGGIIHDLDSVLKPGAGASRKPATTTPTTRRTSPTAVQEEAPQAAEAPEAPRATIAEPVRTYDDPAGIRSGMASAELVRRFGPPMLDVVGADIGRIMTYSAKSGTYQLEVKGDKVGRISVVSRRQTAMSLSVSGSEPR